MVEMRTAFAAYSGQTTSPRHWATSFLASSTIYVGIVLTAITIGSARKVARLAEKAIDVTFVEKVVKEPPPPVAVPVVPPVPAAAAPVVRPDQKIRRLDKPPPPKVLTAPKEMPQEAPREADPSEDKGIAVYGEPGQGDPAGLEGGSAGGQVGGVIALPDDADPPMPARTNAVPAYPQEARASGKMGTVVLKVIILADGSVARVEVMRGDEPFVSAALATVKSWKYTPARYKGHPIAVYRIIQIPFKLTA